MNFTPSEMEKYNFCKAMFSGYSQSQVDAFVAKIIEDARAYIAKIDQLKNQLVLAEGKVQHYRTIEEALQHTLLIAQNTSEAIKTNACEKAANIINEAEVQAQKIINEANQEVVRIKQQYEEIKKSLNTFRIKTESLIRGQLELLAEPDESEGKASGS